jgi:hypothetical protein
MRSAYADSRRPRRDSRPPFLGGPEVVLLVFAAVTAVAFPVGYVIARRFPSTGESVLIGGAYLGILFAFGIKMIRRRVRVERFGR